MQSFVSQEGGKELSVDDVIWYLDQKKYAENVSSLEVQDFVQRSVIGQTLLKVSDNSEALPENEMVRITIDPHSYLAKIRLYPSSDKGSRLTEENVLSLLAQNDVHHGILMQNLTLLLNAELYCTDVLIAKAVLPVQGKCASITYHFDVQKTNTPTMKEDGSVDFHRLDMIERVEKGQLLATLTPETAPIPGTDVRGNVIQPAKLTPVVLKHGKNIHLSEDQLEMYADCAGNVTLVNDTVFVSNVYEVPADVGTSTGDIDYDGSVEVRGNVLTGYTVKATGDITVNGAVEGATLISGGKIVIKRGMQGMEKGVMRAGGDIISNFIESSKVHASGRGYERRENDILYRYVSFADPSEYPARRERRVPDDGEPESRPYHRKPLYGFLLVGYVPQRKYLDDLALSGASIGYYPYDAGYVSGKRLVTEMGALRT